MKKTLSLTLASLSLIALTNSAFAAEAKNASIVVTKTTCSKMANTNTPFILVLNTGDEVMESISQCAKDAKLSGATISGLGQLHNPTLAYFTGKQGDKPTLTTFPGHYELASMNGNIATSDENYYTHIHSVLADKNFRGIAGHIKKAKVGLTAEVTIVPFTAPLQRNVDPKTGFGPIVQS